MTIDDQPLPQLFVPDVVWDSTPLRIVKNMDEAECLAMVKSIARKWRVRSATIHHAFRGLDNARLVNARFLAENALGVHSEKDSESTAEGYGTRHRELAEENLAEIMQVVASYRRDAGFRFLCLLALSAEQGHSVDTVKAAAALRHLGRVQASHLETLSLIDRVKMLHKCKTSENKSRFGEEQLLLSRLIDAQLTATFQVIKKIDSAIDGKTLEQHYENMSETHSDWSDSNLPELKLAESVVRVFRMGNTAFTSQLWREVHSFTEESMPEARVFRAAS